MKRQSKFVVKNKIKNSLQQQRLKRNKKILRGALATGMLRYDFNEMLNQKLKTHTIQFIAKEIGMSVLEISEWQKGYYPDIIETGLICHWMKRSIHDYLD